MLRREIIDLLPTALVIVFARTFSLNALAGKSHYAKNPYLHIISSTWRKSGISQRSFGFIAYQKHVYLPALAATAVVLYANRVPGESV
jgi:hypothetical protein